MATHSNTLAWQIPWMEEPVRLQSMGSLGVRHNWATSLSLFTFMRWRRKWQPTPVCLPGESQGWGSLVGCHLWVAQSRTRLKRLSSSSRELQKGYYQTTSKGEVTCNSANSAGITTTYTVLGKCSNNSRNGYPLQYSCRENPKNREAWWAPCSPRHTVQAVGHDWVTLPCTMYLAPVPTTCEVLTLPPPL